MKRRGRVRRVVKWAGVVLSALAVALWVVSLIWTVYRDGPCGLRGMRAGVMGGRVGLVLWDPRDHGMAAPPDVSWHASGRSEPVGWIPTVGIFNSGSPTEIAIPPWIPLLLVAGPTAWLGWRDRRRPRPGHCAACGYHLAGLASNSACPECGTGAAAGRVS